MKKLFLVSLTAIAISAVSGMSFAAGQQDFVLVNKTGYTIDQVYVAPSASKNWLNDVLGQEVLGDGEHAKIVFSAENEICKYDLKVIYDDKEEVEWGDIDLCKEEKVTIHWDKKSGNSSATFE